MWRESLGCYDDDDDYDGDHFLDHSSFRQANSRSASQNPTLFEPGDSLSFSQDTADGPYPEPDESCQQPSITLL